MNNTKIKLIEEANKGCRDVSKLKDDAAIEVAIRFIGDHREKSKMHQAVKSFLLYRDENLHDMKVFLARSVIEENYDDLEDMFEIAREELNSELFFDAHGFYKPRDETLC